MRTEWYISDSIFLASEISTCTHTRTYIRIFAFEIITRERRTHMLEHPSEPGVAAVDEVGRGCLAFPVYAAAVVFDPMSLTEFECLPSEDRAMFGQIRDSKKLSAVKRTQLTEFITKRSAGYGVGCATPEEIDRLNIRNATVLAMHRALDELANTGTSIRSILVDGNVFKPYGQIPHACVVQGDATHINIAAASILAKTRRDAHVEASCADDPSLNERYDFLANKAYGTPRHLSGLRRFGPTPHHRMSFAPVAAAEAEKATQPNREKIERSIRSH